MIHDLLVRLTGYPGLFVFCAVSGLLVPLPEDISLLYVGMRLESGEMAWGPALGAAMAGVMTRDVIAYGIGRFIGEWLLARRWAQRLIGDRKIEVARRMVASHAGGAVLAGRFLIGLRAPVFLVAGASGVSFRRFVAFNALGMLVAVPGVIVLGYVFGAPLVEDALWLVRNARWWVILALALLGSLLWMRWRVDRRSLATDDALDVGEPDMALDADPPV